MKGLTLKHVRYFTALSRHKHFGRAAAACAISQPALSLQIKELEEILGASLVERSGRQIRLTRLGDAFAVQALKILQAADDAENLVRASRSDLTGPFRLGIIPTIAPYLLPRTITLLGQRYPQLDIHIRESVTPKLEDNIRAGNLDAAIVALPMSEPSFTEVSLFSETFMLVRAQTDAQEPVPGPERLQQMKLLLLEEGHCFRDQALSFCRVDAVHPRDVMEGSSLSTLVQMVGAGIGVTLIPEMAVAVETLSAAVSVSRFDQPEPKRTIGMIWRKTNPMDAQLRQLANTVKEATPPRPE